MRVIETQGWPEQNHPSYRLGIYVGLANEPLLEGVTEGEQVILRESPDLEVDADMHQVLLNGRDIWFAALTSDYRDLASSR